MEVGIISLCCCLRDRHNSWDVGGKEGRKEESLLYNGHEERQWEIGGEEGELAMP